jgi:glucose/arabinose dehydrogenase
LGVSWVLLIACNPACGARRAAEPASAPEARQAQGATASPEVARGSDHRVRALPGEIATRGFEPQAIKVELAGLPAPFATESATQGPDVVPPPEGATLEVPVGFRVQLFASEVSNARWLREAPDGRILVAQSRDNLVTWLRDRDRDGVAEGKGTFADEANALDIPFGMAFAGDGFFLGNQSAVRRYRFSPGQERLEGEGEVITQLPGGGYRQHWTRNVVVSPAGDRLFVSIGSAENVAIEPSPRAEILVMDLAGSERRTFASGLRNPVGLDFHPDTGALYTTVNERDGLGDDLVPDYLTRVDEGAFYGWPYTYLAPSNPDPRLAGRGGSEARRLAARTRTPEVLFQAHSAALGLAFYRGTAFPERYRGGAFVAFRGSWNRAQGTGYKIVFIPFSGGAARGHYEDFVRGFLIEPSIPRTWGRPVGVLSVSDGSLLFTDETGGRIYRVSYVGGE